jgi:hypothetical protein
MRSRITLLVAKRGTGTERNTRKTGLSFSCSFSSSGSKN